MEDPDLRRLNNAFQRLDPRSQLLVVALLVIAATVFVFVYLHNQQVHQARQSQAPSQPSVGTVNLLLGNPSNATADPGTRDNYLMVKPFFTLSYNDENGAPNWVSWRVTFADLGDAPRARVFEPDPTLPPSFKRVFSHDYTASGFDRGHICPHGDRSANTDMSYATFVMTNIVPQAPNVNRKAWEQLESYCRELVTAQHAHLYIHAGPAGRGGRGSEGPRDSIGNGKVLIPASCWKVVVVVPDGGAVDDLANINAGTRVIAVLMPNDNDRVGDEWAHFRTSAAQIEAQTGLRFFTSIAPDVAQVLRQKIDTMPIPPPPPRHERQ